MTFLAVNRCSFRQSKSSRLSRSYNASFLAAEKLNKASFEKGKNVIFVEKAEQVNLFKNYFEKTNFKNEYQIVAIGPSAQSSLIKFGIPYFKSDYFFKNYDHINVLKKRLLVTRSSTSAHISAHRHVATGNQNGVIMHPLQVIG